MMRQSIQLLRQEYNKIVLATCQILVVEKELTLQSTEEGQ